jgi:flavodoxin
MSPTALSPSDNQKNKATEALGNNSGRLVAYFSWSGFTAAMAKIISQKLGAALYEIEPADPYPIEYGRCLARAQDELTRQDWPDLKTHLPDLENYATIFLGFPNWLGSLPRVVATFVKLYDLNDKIVAPFCSYGGAGAGQSLADLENLLPLAEFKPPLVIRVSHVKSLYRKIEPWLETLALHF